MSKISWEWGGMFLSGELSHPRIPVQLHIRSTPHRRKAAHTPGPCGTMPASLEELSK